MLDPTDELFLSIMPILSDLEEWRDSQHPITKGCGCCVLIGVGFLACAMFMGAIMGDYGGPPEGRAQDIHTKNVMMLGSFCVIGACGLTGLWLVSTRRR